MKVGYIRVSTAEQNTARQEVLLEELERGYILDRQREGIAIAKSEGKYKGRPHKKIDEDLWNELYIRWKNGEITAVEFMGKVGLRKSAFYERVKMAR